MFLDDAFWNSLITHPGQADSRKAYEAAQHRALSFGFSYREAGDIASGADLGVLLDRVAAAGGAGARGDQDAVLGLVPRPRVTVSEAFELYLREIAPDTIAAKSAQQKRTWEKVKRRAVSNFVAVVGDVPIGDITRAQANRFYQHWLARITNEGLSGSSGNRDVGNMRKLFHDYHRHIGHEGAANPFRNLSFTARDKKKILPFPTAWLQALLRQPDQLAQLNRDAKLIVYCLIETGCRPSEIANLTREAIRLDHEVPHIAIRPDSGREIKTRSSIREIPLVGVSLAAMRCAPDGFARYRDRTDALSSLLLKYFRNNDLYPDGRDGWRIYSFRHAFEKRMLEADLDYGLRCDLMGHTTTRPDYGDGGSLTFRRDQLLKIALDFDAGLVG